MITDVFCPYLTRISCVFLFYPEIILAIFIGGAPVEIDFSSIFIKNTKGYICIRNRLLRISIYYINGMAEILPI